MTTENKSNQDQIFADDLLLDKIELDFDLAQDFDLGGSIMPWANSTISGSVGYIHPSTSLGGVLTNNSLSGGCILPYNSNYPSYSIAQGAQGSPQKISFIDDTEFSGSVKIKGKDIGQLLETIQKRLAIIDEPSPERLAKFAALKKAYEHYKTLEALIDHDDDTGS